MQCLHIAHRVVTVSRMDTRTRPEFRLEHRLKLARVEAGITLEDMRRHFRKSRRTMSNWENGHTEPTALELREWADMCGVDLEWLDPEHDLRSRCSDRGAA